VGGAAGIARGVPGLWWVERLCGGRGDAGDGAVEMNLLTKLRLSGQSALASRQNPGCEFGDSMHDRRMTEPRHKRGFSMVRRNGSPSGLPFSPVVRRFANLLLPGHPFGEGRLGAHCTIGDPS